MSFPNAKNMTGLTLSYMENFGAQVNTNESSVQIPTDIWDEGEFDSNRYSQRYTAELLFYHS